MLKKKICRRRRDEVMLWPGRGQHECCQLDPGGGTVDYHSPTTEKPSVGKHSHSLPPCTFPISSLSLHLHSFTHTHTHRINNTDNTILSVSNLALFKGYMNTI